MSELITQRPGLSDFRWRLLATASALTLLALTVSEARAEDTDRPTVWIELGGQLSQLENGQEPYAPPFVALTPSNLDSPVKAERPPGYSVDESAALMFQPNGSDWVFSASVRYGRASSGKHVHDQSYSAEPFTAFRKVHRTRNGVTHDITDYVYVNPIADRFTDSVIKENESHAIVDFQAGKDLGIGLFGHDASSWLNVGVRFAQFTSKSRTKLKENPDWQFKTHISNFGFSYSYYGSRYTFLASNQDVDQPYHSFAGTFRADRSFSGIGPSISWNASEPFLGDSQAGELTFDWGVNAALLFGRQKTKTHHQTTSLYHSQYAGAAQRTTAYIHPATPDHVRSRGIVVPNIGAFAGFSVKYPNVKVSFGYKADFFFGAMDGGIDVRRAEDVSFHGPYASVSIGLGG